MTTDVNEKLIDACEAGDLVTVKEYIEKSEKPILKDDYMVSLALACENGHLDLAKFLCKTFSPFRFEGVNAALKNNAPFCLACQNGHLDIAKYLVKTFPPGTEYGVDATVKENYALRFACEKGHVDVVKYLCETFPPGKPGGVNPSVRHNSPLYFACLESHLDVVKYLCESFPPGSPGGIVLPNFESWRGITEEMREYLTKVRERSRKSEHKHKASNMNDQLKIVT